MRRAAYILHAQLFARVAAVVDVVRGICGYRVQQPGYLHCVRGCGGDGVEFVVDDDKRLEGVDLYEVEVCHAGLDVT